MEPFVDPSLPFIVRKTRWKRLQGIQKTKRRAACNKVYIYNKIFQKMYFDTPLISKKGYLVLNRGIVRDLNLRMPPSPKPNIFLEYIGRVLLILSKYCKEMVRLAIWFGFKWLRGSSWGSKTNHKNVLFTKIWLKLCIIWKHRLFYNKLVLISAKSPAKGARNS